MSVWKLIIHLVESAQEAYGRSNTRVYIVDNNGVRAEIEGVKFSDHPYNPGIEIITTLVFKKEG